MTKDTQSSVTPATDEQIADLEDRARRLEYRDMLSLIARIRASELVWQDIATAPRDGMKFDVWCVHPESRTMGVRFTDVQMRGDKTGFGFVYHLRDGVCWQYLDGRGSDNIFPKWIPTHWMPLPEAPEVKP